MRGQTEPAVARLCATDKAATGSGSIVPNSGAFVCAGQRRRPGGRTADVMSDLRAARTTVRPAQCRESRARRTHEFARSAGRADRTEPTSPHCQPKRNKTPCLTTKLSFSLSKFRLLWQTAKKFSPTLGKSSRGQGSVHRGQELELESEAFGHLFWGQTPR